MSKITVLCLDPSFLATGWSILTFNGKRTNALHWGWLPTWRDKDLPVTVDDIFRCYSIAKDLSYLLEKYKPDMVCTEIPLGSQSASAAKSLGIVKGIVATVCCLRHIKTRYINPFAVKKALCGKNNAEKQEVISAVEKVYPKIGKIKERTTRTGTYTKKHEAVCDSIAVGLAAMWLTNSYTELESRIRQR